ncbi:MAG: hypothetical protein KKB70_00630 [Proteobacteria bacterium]|nr:hypothetical protein [Pseudomonadota bacterium]MBU1610582.1 hypothetical protein [Pseudomonadota bacterium]
MEKIVFKDRDTLEAGLIIEVRRGIRVLGTVRKGEDDKWRYFDGPQNQQTPTGQEETDLKVLKHKLLKAF